MSKSPWGPPLPILHITACKETSEGGEEGREYQLSFQPSALDCQRLRKCTHGQATLPKSTSILHLLLRDLSHPQTFRFPWQAYNRSMLYLTLDVQWQWLGTGQGVAGGGGFLLFQDLCPKTPRGNWEDKAIPQPGGLSPPPGSQVVTASSGNKALEQKRLRQPASQRDAKGVLSPFCEAAQIWW